MNIQMITETQVHSRYHFKPVIILIKQMYAKSFVYKHVFVL